jgi:6,7-dimethyl-8-ribityllumazine synthase
MSQHNSGLLNASKLEGLVAPRVAIVYTEWNEAIVSKLLEGCERVLDHYGVKVVSKVAVPGAFEIPFACRQIWQHFESHAGRPEAIITFGAVIRGGTPHFEYVCKAATEGILQLNLTLPIPTIFGVLTLDNEQQALERLGGPHGHKGEEAALTALKMIQCCRNLQHG